MLSVPEAFLISIQGNTALTPVLYIFGKDPRHATVRSTGKSLASIRPDALLHGPCLRKIFAQYSVFRLEGCFLPGELISFPECVMKRCMCEDGESFSQSMAVCRHNARRVALLLLRFNMECTSVASFCSEGTQLGSCLVG